VCQTRALKAHAAAGPVAPGNGFPRNSLSADPKIATNSLYSRLGLESLIPQLAECQSLRGKTNTLKTLNSNTRRQEEQFSKSNYWRKDDSHY